MSDAYARKFEDMPEEAQRKLRPIYGEIVKAGGTATIKEAKE